MIEQILSEVLTFFSSLILFWLIGAIIGFFVGYKHGKKQYEHEQSRPKEARGGKGRQTAFPPGTVVHYQGIPCELLSVSPYYSETINQ